MRALHVINFNDLPALVEIPTPTPGKGEVLVRQKACGLNFADLLMCKGTYQETPEPPFALGLESAGEIVEVGEGVIDLAVGMRVAIFGGTGGLSEYAAVPATFCTPLPDTIDDITAAGFQIAYGTSHLALTHRATLKRGEKLLVTGAAGGVGLTAVEIGAALGAEVIAAARGKDRLDIARKAGAAHVIDTETDDLRERVLALGGADVVYDSVGGDLFKPAFRACNPLARYLLIGFASGDVPQIPANHLLVKNIDAIGFYWGAYLKFRPDLLTGSMTELFEIHAKGALTPHISHVLDLDHATDGLDLLRTRSATGKVVITL